MVALSIRQPWAWAILFAGKDIENRSWSTKFRGRVLIHTGGKIDKDGIEFLSEDMNIALPQSYLIGGIVGMVDIVDCVKKSDSKWFFGEYGFVLKNPSFLPFMPCKGQLNFFNVNYQAGEGW